MEQWCAESMRHCKAKQFKARIFPYTSALAPASPFVSPRSYWPFEPVGSSVSGTCIEGFGDHCLVARVTSRIDEFIVVVHRLHRAPCGKACNMRTDDCRLTLHQTLHCHRMLSYMLGCYLQPDQDRALARGYIADWNSHIAVPSPPTSYLQDQRSINSFG